MSTCHERGCIIPPTTGDRYGHCGLCHRDFMGLTAFDKHRRGPWEARVCIDPAMDTATTLTGKPLARWWQDGNGRWHEGDRDPRFMKEQDQ